MDEEPDQKMRFGGPANDTMSTATATAATVVQNGKAISVRFRTGTSNIATEEETLFHASWLWINDPKYKHPTSGQRLRTPGQYSPMTDTIASVEIVLQTSTNDSSSSLLPPPPLGSFHSIGGLHNETTTTPLRPMLQVTWTSSNNKRDPQSTTATSSSSEADVSLYDMQWLARCRYDIPALERKLEHMKITKSIALGAIHNPDCVPIQRIDYRDLILNNGSSNNNKEEDDEVSKPVLLQTLQAILEQGAVLLDHAPRMADGPHCTVAKVGRTLSAGGQLSHGALYGDTFHVLSLPDANNIAFTSVALPPHQDLTYYESKPLLQLLHCVSHAPPLYRHGESVLMDAMAAAEEFRRLAPDLFDILLHCEATFLKQRAGADMVASKPHVQISPTGWRQGGGVGGVKSDGGNVIAVNWSPPFEGGPLLIPPSLMEDYFVAYRAFELMLDNSLVAPSTTTTTTTRISPELEGLLRDYAKNYTWEYNVQPGEMLIFNNARMLHGRRSFSMSSSSGETAQTSTRSSSSSSSSSSSDDKDKDENHDFDGLNDTCSKGRHLVGCYTGAMETLSLYRLLLSEQPNRDHIVVRNAGNGTPGSA
jgi:Taurine catabolism dioxygenase TauD, TfdA family